MGLRILYDSRNELAAMYCSTSDVAFGPVFYQHEGHDADERLQAFLRWLEVTETWTNYEKGLDFGHRDPRCLTDAGVQQAHSDWCAQEAEQWQREEATASS